MLKEENLLLPQRKLYARNFDIYPAASEDRLRAMSRVANRLSISGAASSAVGAYEGSVESNIFIESLSPKFNAVDFDFSSFTTENSGACLESLVTMQLCALHVFLPTVDLFRFAVVSKSLRRFYGALRFHHQINFSTYLRWSRAKKNGILEHCELLLKNDEAGIDPFLLEQLHTQLSSTPTRKQTTRIVAFDLHLGSHIDSYLILNLLSTVQQQRFAFLQALNLEDCLVGPDGVSVISSAMMNNELPQLKWLNLNRNQATAKGVNRLRAAMHSPCCPHLEQLSLASNRAEASVLDILHSSSFKQRPQFSVLDISNNDLCLTDADALAVITRGVVEMCRVVTLDLSFNPLSDDGCFRFLSAVWPLSVPYHNLPLQNFILQNCELSNRSCDYIGELMLRGDMPELQRLSLGMNDCQAVGIEKIMSAVCKSRVNMKSLLLPYNKLGNEGFMVVVNAVVIGGGFDKVEELDVSNIGASAESIYVFIRNIVSNGRKMSLKKLALFGNYPFAGKNVREHFPPEFLAQVKVV